MNECEDSSEFSNAFIKPMIANITNDLNHLLAKGMYERSKRGKMNKLIIYPKDDYDGKCSAAIALHKFKNAVLYGYSHYEEVNWKLIEKHKKVIMTDISFQKDDMEMLNKITDLTWIDHHKTAIDDYKHLNIKGIQRTDKSACELCWEYFFPDTKTPKAVTLLGRYDIWQHSDKRTLPFQHGIRYMNLEPDSKEWKDLFSDNDLFYDAEPDTHFVKNKLFDKIIQTGKICLKYQKQTNEFKSQAAFEIKFEGYDCVCINSTYNGSMIFDSFKKEFDIMIIFGYYNKWKVSMYTNKDINVGKIAKKYGGGGHFKASGMSCSTKQMQEFGFIK